LRRTLETIWTHARHANPDRILLVMLPGAHQHAADFAAHGFLETLDTLGAPVDTVAAALEPDDYLRGDAVARLHETVIAPAIQRSYQRLWLLGISLGGMGALLYARAGLARLDGMILLAPFVATRGTIAEVAAAGGLAAWNPGPSGPHDIERGLLGWLKDWSGERPRLWLGYGDGDRYADASRLLAAHLPIERIAIAAGGHDWPTWTTLWRQLVASQTFGARPDEPGNPGRDGV
jgi:pimeloyl-ACP methyl ester carboxylesterase